MEHEGPPLEQLTRRLAETPAEFLGPPAEVETPAVVHDLLLLLGIEVVPARLEPFAKGNPAALGVTLLLCWLLADPWFRARTPAADAVLDLLEREAAELARHGRAERYFADAERREELARLALARLGLRPAGESAEQATDRLTSLSSRERARVLQAARAAEERARKIRAALARKAAAESADKWTRE